MADIHSFPRKPSAKDEQVMDGLIDLSMAMRFFGEAMRSTDPDCLEYSAGVFRIMERETNRLLEIAGR